ncbi:MAG: ABC transporter ATP-binding protein [Treponema sp.]|nr:ABC transporter ATP-binding protein [Treponema sp.]
MPPLVDVHDVKKRFNLEAGFFAQLGRYVYAVNGLSFSIAENESYGLAGESGCGKTTAARLLVRMYNYDSGAITFKGNEIASFKKNDLAQYRQKVKYVFQDPARSLNPRMNVYNVLTSGRRWAGSAHKVDEKKLKQKAAAIIEEVGLTAADLERRPAEFSGGQRQRISIARGLLAEPELLICDEVVSALDVSIQAQILNLLMDIRRHRKLSFLFIAHDLKVACWFCDRIGVMYRGEMMEEAPAANLYQTAAHPYTRLLFSSVLNAVGEGASEAVKYTGTALKGEVRTTLEEITGCSFADRCPISTERCFKEKPTLKEIKTGHKLRCFLSE